MCLCLWFYGTEMWSRYKFIFFTFINEIFWHLFPQRSCEGYVFTGVCLSTGGVLSQHALQEVSQHALQQVSGWVGIPACLAGLGPHPRGKFTGFCPGGSPGPHPRGKFRGICLGGSPGPHPRGKFRGICQGGCLLLGEEGCLLPGGLVWPSVMAYCCCLLLCSSVMAFWFGGLLIEGGLLVWSSKGANPLSTIRPYQKAITEDNTRRP